MGKSKRKDKQKKKAALVPDQEPNPVEEQQPDPVPNDLLDSVLSPEIDDDLLEPEEESGNVKKKKTGFCKLILRFLGSNVGLFIVLT